MSPSREFLEPARSAGSGSVGFKPRRAGHNGVFPAHRIFTADSWLDIVDTADPGVFMGCFFCKKGHVSAKVLVPGLIQMR